jgi:hypothetical protein
MDERGYSRPLDIHRISEYPEVQKVISTIYELLGEAGCLGRAPYGKEVKKHLKVVVLDLFVAYLGDPLVFIGYSRNKNSYGKDTRLAKLFLNYRPMMRVIDGLESLGFIENHKGFYDLSRQSGLQSRMRATPALINLIETGGVTPLMVSNEDGEVIALRDSDGNDLSFPETDETRAISEQVMSYNQFLSEHRISLSLDVEKIRDILKEKQKKPVDYTRTQLCRIFQEDLSSGGRYYRGWWQEVPSELRRYITIDGENCSELDYSGQSLGLLYAYKDHERTWLKGDVDPYTIEGEEGVNRKLMKKVFLTCVNASSLDQALKSIRYYINKECEGLKSTKVFIDRLIDQTIQNHPDIAEYFFSCAWAGLQYQDSEIARYVLEHIQANGCPALPIHDSFVVQDEHLPLLYSLMKESYRMLGVASVPDITLDIGANSDPDGLSFRRLQELMDYEQQLKERGLEAVKALENVVSVDPGN